MAGVPGRGGLRLGSVVVFSSLLAAVPALAGRAGLVLVGFLVLVVGVVFLGVVWPAIWSRDEVRQRNALAVLDRIFRWK